MRLSDFILSSMEEILSEWEKFAGTLIPAAAGLSPQALRDHAQQILETIAQDLTTSQSRQKQSEKSRGWAPKIANAPDTAAETHAVLRAAGGFDINQLVAEYRALRASVLRLWLDCAPLDETSTEDMIRFNEAIDQAVAESVEQFSRAVDRYRNLLLGMLGHDMRNPLNSIVMTAYHLSQISAGKEISEAATCLIRSGASMQALLDDLMDFNRTNLGLGLSVVPTEIELADVVRDELDQFRPMHPAQVMELTITGNTQGRWDGSRVQQLLRNLISNAVHYGSPCVPIQITVRGEVTGVDIEVSNGGQIDSSEIPSLFDPLRRGTAGWKSYEGQEGLGLGLFIVREIALAHGGEVSVRCQENLTTFAVRLPRQNASCVHDLRAGDVSPLKKP